MTKDADEAFEKACESIHAKQTTANGQEKVRAFAAYCAHHWRAIVVRMHHETCGSCIEPQVSHVLSDRLSRNPIAWSREGLNRMTMLVVYTKNGGKVCGEDVRIRLNREAGNGFREDGYAPYRDYAMKQADEVLKAKHDWSIFEHECTVLGKVDWLHLLRKSLGSQLSLKQLVS